MKRIGVFTVVLLLTLLTGLGGVIYLRGSFLFQFILENYSQQFCDCQIQMDKLDWNVKKPLFFQVRSLSVEKNDSTFQVGSLDLHVNPLWITDKLNFKIQFKFDLAKAKINYSSPPDESPADASVAERQSSRQLARQIDAYKHFDVVIDAKDFELKSNLKNKHNYFIKARQLHTQLDGLNKKWQWNLEGDLHFPPELANKPIPIKTQGAIQKSLDKFEFAKTTLNLLGIPFELAGGLTIDSNAIDLKLKVAKTDLATIKTDFSQSPVTQIKGAISGEARITKPSSLEPWQLAGKFNLEELKGLINLTGQKYSLQGPFRLNLSGEAKYNAEAGLEAPSLEWQLDLSESQFHWENLVHKPAQIPLLSSAEMEYTRGINIKSSLFRLANLELSFEGAVDKSKLADLSVEMKPLNLSGLEKVFPFLGNNPLTGQAELIGRYTGNLSKPQSAALVIDKILLENVRGKLDWKTPETTLAGPFAINLKGALNVEGAEVKKGDLDLKVNLAGMEIQSGKSFRKPAQSPFEMKILAAQDHGRLKIKKGFVIGPFGTIDIEGRLPVPPLYSTDLNVATKYFNLNQIKTWIPGSSALWPDGYLKGKISVSGDINSSDLLQSRLTTNGELKMIIPQLSLSANKNVNLSAGTNSAEVVENEPLLPSLPALQSLGLNLDVMIENIYWRSLKFSGVNVIARMTDGKIQGQSSIEKIFDGSVIFSMFEVPLFDLNPTVSFRLKAQNLNLTKGLEALLPPWKDFAQGWFSGEFLGLTKLPSSPTFLNDLQSSGNFQLVQASLRSLPLKKILDSKIPRLPIGEGLLNNFRFQDANLALKAEFALAKQKLSFKPLALLTPDLHQLFLEGQIGFDRTVSLQGPLLIANLKGGGSFLAANKDPEGRLVIPLAIEGSLLQPEVRLVDGTIEDMMEKTIHYQRTRSIANTSNDGKANLQKETRKATEKINEKIKQKAQDGFQKTVRDLLEK